MMSAINSYIESMLQSMPERENTRGVKKFMQSFLGIVIFASVASVYVFMLAKAAVYVFGLFYLNKANIKEQFKAA
jgi:hypothetical protein